MHGGGGAREGERKGGQGPPVQAQRICIVHRQAAPPRKFMHLAKCEVGPWIFASAWQVGRQASVLKQGKTRVVYIYMSGGWASEMGWVCGSLGSGIK